MNSKIVNTYVCGFVVALIFLASVSAARAESPDILFGRDLTVGSSGQDVVVLQGLLSEMGYLNIPITIPFGYFGSMTQSALAQYQAANSIAPVQGYFGPLTKNTMRAQFSSRGWLALLQW